MEDRPGKIFVGGLDFDIDEAEFEKIFSKFGKITEVLLKRDQQTLKSRGFGFITYENPSDADEAVKQLDKQEVKGKMVHVDHAVKPGGGPGGDRGGRVGGFRGRGGPRGGFRGGFSDRGRGGYDRGRGGFRGRGLPRGDRGGRGGFSSRGRGFERPVRGGFDDRRGPTLGKGFLTTRRDSPDRGYGDRGITTVRREEDRYGVMERDRYAVSDRRPRDYPPSPPPRGLERDPVSSYRDYGLSAREYSPPPRDRISSRDYVSSRDMGVTRSSYDTSRDIYSTRDPYAASSSSRRDDYTSSVRDYVSSRDPARDYLTVRDSRASREYERLSSRDGYDSYGRGSPPPRARSPLPPSRSAYSPPPRSAPISRDLERDRIREYSPGARRPAPYDSRGAPPLKRSRADDLAPSRVMSSRDVPIRGIPRERSPPRVSTRDSGRGAMPPTFRR